ncbi:CPBP family intramembrane metalloprotease [Anabaena azotica FACHB-119]|uniref:CPBP family intramembrane metalloprotease n=2 Tax=Anabaena azotica TaxID=197653 RepID=A0ABR8D3T0_9NOST|nr:CPBP family intramembrane metalloprotease [Anabaena azotica FACHB-119]
MSAEIQQQWRFLKSVISYQLSVINPVGVWWGIKKCQNTPSTNWCGVSPKDLSTGGFSGHICFPHEFLNQPARTYCLLFTVKSRLIYRLRLAFSTLPNIQAWLTTVVILLLFTAIALPLGFYTHFLKFEFLLTSPVKIILIIAGCLIIPAILEELVFRVLLLPHLTENTAIIQQLFWGFTSLISFIIYHPLEGLTVYPPGKETSLNPVFLLLVALLGIVCNFAYYQSGSIWTPVFIHWVIVVAWLLFFGGYAQITP